MAEIHPFHGIYYNQSLAKDLAALICPPYDIINPRMQQELYSKSEYNFVRLEFGRELAGDNDTENKYTRSAATMQAWLEQGILETGNQPAIYLHDQYFECQGREYRRRGIICIVKLEEWDKNVVRPHEGTLSKPKGDRLNLLWALQSNTSPVLALYEDIEGCINSVLATHSQGKPMAEINTGTSERHCLWAITNNEAIDQICSCLTNRPLYIADGHHRYESALAFRRERHACSPSESDNLPFDFVMMTLVDFDDPGVVILPAHRLVRGLSESKLDGLLEKLRTIFKIEKLPLDTKDIGRQLDELLAEDAGEVRIILFGLDRKHLYILRLSDFSVVSPMIPSTRSEQYKRLDVSVVDHVMIERLLELSHDTTGEFIEYSHDGPDAIHRVMNQEYQITFILNPVKPEMIKTIADSGDRMPKKSTYFYPKTPVGLVLYRFA